MPARVLGPLAPASWRQRGSAWLCALALGACLFVAVGVLRDPPGQTEPVAWSTGTALPDLAATPACWAATASAPLRPCEGVLWAHSVYPAEHPFLEVRLTPGRPSNANGLAAEHPRQVLEREFPVVNPPPCTVSRESRPSELKTWEGTYEQLPASPWQLWPQFAEKSPQHPWSQIMHWSDLMRLRLLKCDKAQAAGYEPDWDGLAEFDCVGGADGLIILEELMHEDYRDYVWDLARWQRDGGRLHPLRHEHPSQRCAWDLQAMRDECEQRGFPDQELVFDICTWGLGNRARGPRHTWLCPPYRPFFEQENYAFLQKQMRGKRAAEPPKLSAGYPYPLTIPAYCCPTSVNVRWHDDKRRVIKDFGGTRRMGVRGLPDFVGKADDPSPISVNGMTNIANSFDFPPIAYMNMQVMGEVMAILDTVALFVREPQVPAGLGVAQWATDYCAWYEQIPRTSAEDWSQHQFVSAAGQFETDPMLVFGTSSCVAGAQRVEGAACYCAAFRVSECVDATLWRAAAGRPDLQARLRALDVSPALPRATALLPVHAEAEGLDANGMVTDSVLMPLLEWMEWRAARQLSWQWATLGGLIDDTGMYTFEFFHETAARAVRAMLEHWAFEVADGGLKPDGSRRKQKTQSEPQQGHLVLLGVLPLVLSGALAADPDKRRRFAKAHAEVQAAARVTREGQVGRWAPVASVRRLFGQLQNIVVFIFPHWRARLAVLREQVQLDSARDLAVPFLAPGQSERPLWRLRAEAAKDSVEVCWLPRYAETGLCAVADGVFGREGPPPEPAAAQPEPAAPPMQHARRGVETHLYPPEPERLPIPVGVAFVPREGILGDHGLGRLVQWFDASGDTSDKAVGKFRGYGGVQWLEGSDVVLVTQCHFSYNARHNLTSSDLEAVAGFELMLQAQPSLLHDGGDLQQNGDNRPVQEGADSSVVHAPSLRAAIALRECIRETLPPSCCVASCHVVRGRNKAADWLTRFDLREQLNIPGGIDQLQAHLAALLCREVRVHWMPPAPGGAARLDYVLRAAAREKQRKRKEKHQPSHPPLQSPLPFPPLPRWDVHARAWQAAPGRGQDGRPVAVAGEAAAAARQPGGGERGASPGPALP